MPNAISLKKRTKRHRWLGGMACTCGPGGHNPKKKYIDGRTLTKDGLTFSRWVRQCRLGKLTCHYCGAVSESLDHKTPRSKGGKTTPENVVASCNPCNNLKGDMEYWEFMRLRDSNV